MMEESADLDLRDQYISVLLEFYGTKSEIVPESPMDTARLKHWNRVVRLFERLRPEKIRNRARYRAQRAELRNLSPVQIALVRYAWAAFHAADEDCKTVLRRWETYLYGKPANSVANPSDYEQFRNKRQFRELVKAIQESELWPWE